MKDTTKTLKTVCDIKDACYSHYLNYLKMAKYFHDEFLAEDIKEIANLDLGLCNKYITKAITLIELAYKLDWLSLEKAEEMCKDTEDYVYD